MGDGKRLANDNRYLEHGLHDPDRHYARDYMKSVVEHLKDCKIHRSTIIHTLTDEIFKLLPGNPFRDPVDESALLSDLHLLWPLLDRVETLTKQYEKGLDRADRHRQARQEAVDETGQG